jgi:hypothetical protein
MDEARRRKIGDIGGWYGTIAILGAYTLNSFGLVDAHGTIYQLLNLTGALGIVTLGLMHKVFQPVVLNGVWAIIALVSLFKALT